MPATSPVLKNPGSITKPCSLKANRLAWLAAGSCRKAGQAASRAASGGTGGRPAVGGSPAKSRLLMGEK